MPHLDPAISHYQYGAGNRQRQYRFASTLDLKKILNASFRPEPGSMADDDEIRKIIQATGGGEYNARLGE